MRATRSYRAPRSTLDIDRFMHPRDEDAGAQKNWCDWSNLTRGQLNVIEIALQPGACTGVLAEHYVDKVIDALKQTKLHDLSTVTA